MKMTWLHVDFSCWLVLVSAHYNMMVHTWPRGPFQCFKPSAGSKYEVGIFLPPIIRFLHKGMTVKNKCATFKLRRCIIHDSVMFR